MTICIDFHLVKYIINGSGTCYSIMLRFVFLILYTFIAMVVSSETPEEVEVDDHRIINGEDAEIEDFPYTLFFYAISKSYVTIICGAVIISKDWAMTAAHCANRGVEKHLRLHTNSTRISGGIEGRGHYVSKRIVHPLYTEDANGDNADYDISLLRVDPPFVLGPGTMPIGLPDQDEPTAVGANGTVTGWGTKDGRPSQPSSVLQKTTLAVTDHAQCVTQFANAPVPTRGEVTPRMICAQGAGSGCVGDSGGPFVVGDRLIGLVSWGAEGCVGYPNVFSRVASFRNWVRNNTGV